jgi:hypothetical protein
MYYVGYQTFLFDRGFMSGVGMSTDRYIPTLDDFNVDQPEGRPRPTGAGDGILLQSTSSGIEGYSL